MPLKWNPLIATKYLHGVLILAKSLDTFVFLQPPIHCPRFLKILFSSLKSLLIPTENSDCPLPSSPVRVWSAVG